MMLKVSKRDRAPASDCTTYRPQQVPLYQGNPWIAALPPILSRREINEGLTRDLSYDPAHATLGSETRLDMVNQIEHFVQPLAIHVELFRRLSMLLRSGYAKRNPVSPQFNARLLALRTDDWLHHPAPPLRGTSASMLAIVGASGGGKTTCIAAALDLYQQVILHNGLFLGQPYICQQVVWIKLDCPHDCSIGGLCYQFFGALDEALGLTGHDSYERQVVSARHTVDQMISSMATLATIHGLGLLVIDEIQNLVQARNGSDQRMLNYLVSLSNRIGVPVVLVGTFGAVKVLGGKFRQARRSCGLGDFTWDRMQLNEEFRFFCRSLGRYQYVRSPLPVDSNEFDAVIDVLYDESQGITALAVKLFMLSQMRAITLGELLDATTEDEHDRARIAANERLTPELVRWVSLDCFRLVRPLLRALKEGLDKNDARLDDLISELSLEEMANTATAVSDLTRGTMRDATPEEPSPTSPTGSMTAKHEDRGPAYQRKVAPGPPPSPKPRPPKRRRSTRKAPPQADARLMVASKQSVQASPSTRHSGGRALSARSLKMSSERKGGEC